jgi:hypothetical protein
LLPGWRDVGAIISRSLINCSQGATIFKLRFCYIQVQFITQVLWLGGRITDASPAASRGRYLPCLKTLHSKFHHDSTSFPSFRVDFERDFLLIILKSLPVDNCYKFKFIVTIDKKI